MQRTSRLRLAWVNPDPHSAPGPRAALGLVAAPPVPARPIKLDLAIERHLGGQDGLSEGEFLLTFSGRGR